MNKYQPLVSIGLPVNNGEKYLAQAITSILNQTYVNFELIISDNASIDSTQEICQSFIREDRRIKYVRNEINLGAAPNFNNVFHLSSGKYFKWAAHDDLLDHEYLTKCVDLLDQNPGVVLCFPQTMIIDEKGNHLGIHIFKKNFNSVYPHVRFRDIVLIPDTAFQVFGLARSEVLRNTALMGSFPSSDVVLLAELALQGQFYEIPEPLFFLRYHCDQSTRGIYEVERDRVSWFDTSLSGKIRLPKWEYLFGLLSTIKRNQLRLPSRLICYLMIIRWAFMPPHFRALGKDILIAVLRLYRSTLIRNNKITMN